MGCVCSKVIAHGLLAGEGAYLRDSWNILDGFVVVVSIVSLVFSQYKFVRTMRLMRAMRPLRVINRNPGMKLVVNCLLQVALEDVL